MMKDEPPTSKPLPATCCHCPLGTREATAASCKSTRIDRVTNHCTESRQVFSKMDSKQQPRCTIQQRQTYRLSPPLPPACKALQKRVAQRVNVERSPQHHRLMQTSLGGPATATLMAVFEARTSHRRPHHATQLAVHAVHVKGQSRPFWPRGAPKELKS